MRSILLSNAKRTKLHKYLVRKLYNDHIVQIEATLHSLLDDMMDTEVLKIANSHPCTNKIEQIRLEPSSIYSNLFDNNNYFSLEGTTDKTRALAKPAKDLRIRSKKTNIIYSIKIGRSYYPSVSFFQDNGETFIATFLQKCRDASLNRELLKQFYKHTHTFSSTNKLLAEYPGLNDTIATVFKSEIENENEKAARYKLTRIANKRDKKQLAEVKGDGNIDKFTKTSGEVIEKDKDADLIAESLMKANLLKAP